MTTPEQRQAKRRAYYLRHREQVKAKSRAYYQAHREERIAYAAAYKKARPPKRNQVPATCHPEQPHFAKGLCGSCYSRDYYASNKDTWRKAYGYAPGEYDRKLAEQDGRCALCGDTARLVPDHDHETGLPRRPLCEVCNKALGLFHDDPLLLARAAEYIAAHKPLMVANG